MTDPAHISMASNEPWREHSKFLAREILAAAQEHGFAPEFNLVLDTAVGLLARTSYRAGFEVQAERVASLESDIEVLKVEKAGAQERTRIACEHFDSVNTRAHALADAIKKHRAQKADDRCIFDDDVLYDALGDGIKCDRRVGSQEAMLQNCERFIKCRTEQGHWPTYVELETERDTLKLEVEVLRARPSTALPPDRKSVV